MNSGNSINDVCCTPKPAAPKTVKDYMIDNINLVEAINAKVAQIYNTVTPAHEGPQQRPDDISCMQDMVTYENSQLREINDGLDAIIRQLV